MVESSPSALIIRLDAIGDALALAPLLAALGAAGIASDLVLGEKNAGIFAPRAARAVLTAPFALRDDGAANRAAIARFGATLARNGYSHVLVATEDPSGYRLAGATAAAHRIGFSNGWGKPFKTLWSRRLLTQSVSRSAGLDARAPHECSVLFQLGRTLVDESEPTRDVVRLRPLVLAREPEPDERIVVQITDKWERLGMPDAEVVAMLDRIEPFGTRAIAFAGESEYADRIARAAGIAVERMRELDEWKAAIAAAPALVAPDSGAIHVAGMVGTPTVAIFPPTRNFALQVARWAPWASVHRIVEAGDGWPVRTADALAQLL